MAAHLKLAAQLKLKKTSYLLSKEKAGVQKRPILAWLRSVAFLWAAFRELDPSSRLMHWARSWNNDKYCLVYVFHTWPCQAEFDVSESGIKTTATADSKETMDIWIYIPLCSFLIRKLLVNLSHSQFFQISFPKYDQPLMEMQDKCWVCVVYMVYTGAS